MHAHLLVNCLALSMLLSRFLFPVHVSCGSAWKHKHHQNGFMTLKGGPIAPPGSTWPGPTNSEVEVCLG